MTASSPANPRAPSKPSTGGYPRSALAALLSCLAAAPVPSLAAAPVPSLGGAPVPSLGGAARALLASAPEEVAGGGYAGYALIGGVVWAWGDDLEGQLGNGADFTTSSLPVRVARLSGVVAIAASANSAYALRNDGTVWAWGDDGEGQLGDGQQAYSNERPERARALTAAVAIAAGGFSAYALQKGGSVWAWGDNAQGQLGQRLSLLEANAPVEVAHLAGAVSIAAGVSTAYALRGDGTVWAWGDNSSHELGGAKGVLPRTAPVRVGALKGVKALAASAFTAFALAANGTVWAWGDGSYGLLGACPRAKLPNCPASQVPRQVRGLHDVVSLAAGGSSAYALEANGEVWAWGDNASGQLGDGHFASSAKPVRVMKLPRTVAIAAGGNAAYAVSSDGTVWAWGDNSYGQLGNGTENTSATPVHVELPSPA